MTLLAQKIDPFGQVHSALGWAPSLPVVRAGLRGGCWIFFGKTTRFAQTSFSGKKSNSHPAPTGIGGYSLKKNSCSVCAEGGEWTV